MKNENKLRFFEIDALRGLSILGVMVIHILSFNLNNPVTTYFWNYLQFVVVIFVFCSGFVLSSRKFNSFKELLAWYKKRVLRILLPFYVYFAVHYVLFLIFPQYFTNYGMQRNISFVLKSMTLTGGISANWIPLLFIQLTLIFPLLTTSQKPMRKILAAITLIVSFIFCFYTFPYSHYRAIMWLPWSLILYIAMESRVRNIIVLKMRSLLLSGLVSLVVYGMLIAAYLYLGKHTSEFNFINNKYPPNLYYFAYSLAVSIIVFIGIRTVKWGERAKGAFEFLSKNSYSLFFVHFLFLDALISWRKMSHVSVPVLVQIVVIMGLAVGVVYAYNRVKENMK